MLRYIVLVVLIGVTFSYAYKPKHLRRQEYYDSEPDYGDYGEYDYPIYAKESDSDSGNTRPSIFSFWNKLLKRTRLPNWNITNPFSKLFPPYVIKVDFPPGTDPSADPKPPRNRNKKKEPQQEDYVYLNTYSNSAEPENTQYFYDPVTQQYYEVLETASQDYSPQDNFYATTFNDDEEIVVNMSDSNEQEKEGVNEGEYEHEVEDEIYSGKVKNVGFLGKYNSPAIKKLKTKQFNAGRRATANYRKPSKRRRWTG